MRHRYLVLALALLALLLVSAAPTFAQPATDTPAVVTATPNPEATAEPTPAPPVIVIPPAYDGLTARDLLFGFLLLGVLAAGAFILRPLIVQAGANVSGPVLEISLAAITRAMEEAVRIARGSQTPIDDALVEELNRQIKVLEQEIRDQRNTITSLKANAAAASARG